MYGRYEITRGCRKRTNVVPIARDSHITRPLPVPEFGGLLGPNAVCESNLAQGVNLQLPLAKQLASSQSTVFCSLQGEAKADVCDAFFLL